MSINTSFIPVAFLAVQLGLLAGSSAQFADVSIPAGISNIPGYSYGAAWGDYNNDGFVDLYLSIGATTTGLNALLRNNGNGTFTRVGPEAGPITTDAHDSWGCTWADFDNDGFLDLLVINGGWSPSRNDLYWNNGDGTFKRGDAGYVTQALRIWGANATADYDGDGWLDFHMADGGAYAGPFFAKLYRGDASGGFIPSDLGPSLSTFVSASWGDYDGDGDQDLMACNIQESTLWRNDGGGQFAAVANTVASSGPGHAAWGDYDRDGDLDIAVRRPGLEASIYRNDGVSGFNYVTGFTQSYGRPAWADYDNDGLLDLLYGGTPNIPRKPGLYHNNGNGTFSPVVDLFTETADFKIGSVWADYDNDGFMDIVFTHQYGTNRLYRNLGNTNHWIKFKLVGTVSNRDGIGAKVRVQALLHGQTIWQMQAVTGCYGTQNDIRPNFGLADATNATIVRIEWPSGLVQELKNVAANQILTVVESQGYPGAPPQFSGGAKTASGAELSFTEPAAGVRYVLEASTNLVTWTKLAARTSAGVATNYLDTRATNYSRRFYQIHVP